MIISWFSSVLFFSTFFFAICDDAQQKYWNPCPNLRSKFDGIVVDNVGEKHAKCVCNQSFFGEKCSLKVYNSKTARNNAISKTHIPSSSSQSEQSIYPFKSLAVHRYPNGSTLIQWQHEEVVSLKHYLLYFRPFISQHSDWSILHYLQSQRHHHHTATHSFLVHDFDNMTTYEINVVMVTYNDDIIASVSVFADLAHFYSSQEVTLKEVLYTEALTWTEWSKWGKCETKNGCGKGKQYRERLMKTEGCINDKDVGTRLCKLKHCPVNGGWSLWSSWSRCAGYCNQSTKTRTRSCTNPRPKHGGKKCLGEKSHKIRCKNKSCDRSMNGGYWLITRRIRRFSFTTFIIGGAAGFILCLLFINCPRLLMKLKRKYKGKSCPQNYDYLPLSRKVVSRGKMGAIPTPPPPPPIHNDPTTCKQPATDDSFMLDLKNAFKNFNLTAKQQDKK